MAQGYTNYIADDNSRAALLNDINVTSRSFGGPFIYTDAVDPALNVGAARSGNQIMGRMTAQRIMHDPTIISLCPGKVKFSSGSGSDGAQRLYDYVANGTGDIGSISEDSFGNDKMLFTFKQDYSNYMNYVNLLAGAMACYMKIGDEEVYLPSNDGTAKSSGIKFRNMDWRKYQLPSETVESTGGLFNKVQKELENTQRYVHFYGQNNSSYNEDMSTSTRESNIKSQIEGAMSSFNGSDIMQDVTFMSGFSTDESTAALLGMIKNNSGLDSTTGLGQILGLAGDYLKGGHMVFPQMIADSTFGKSISLSFKFVSPYGDPKSCFMNCYLPLAYLMAMSLPRQLGANSYTYPFLVKVYSKGWMNCEMGVVTSFRVQRGGQEDTQWTSDTLTTEIDVSMDVTPLYNSLMVSKVGNPANNLNFFKNTGLQEYLGTICGMNMKGDIGNIQLQLARMLAGQSVRSIPANIAGAVNDWFADKVKSFVNIP